MAYIPLPAYRTGPGINLEPVNAALDSIQQQNNQNRQFGLQQRASDRADQQLAFEQGQAKQAADRQNVELFGKRATAIDQAFPVGDPRRAQAYQNLISTHQKMFPGQTLTEEELDPANGPKLMAAQAGMYLDPRDSQAKDLALQETRAKINKLNVEAQNGGEAYGKTGAIFLNPETGRYEAVQFGGRGQVKRTELGGLTPSKGVETVGDELIDKATGQPIRNVGANIAAGKSAAVQGEAQGKAAINLPLAENSAQRMIGAIDTLLSPNSGLERVTGTVYGRLPEWTNTSEEAKNAQSQIDYINGNTFLQAYNDLRGAGAITEKEGEAAQAAYNRLRSQQLGTESYKKALAEFRSEVVKLRDIARDRARGGNPAALQPEASSGASGFKYLGRVE
jgi:hypothetical protein